MNTSWCHRSLAIASFCLGIVLLVDGLLRAGPAGDGCSDRCFERHTFIDSPNLECYSYLDKDCEKCVNGRCVDQLVGPTLRCVPTDFQVSRFEYELCSLKCTLPLNKSAEATTKGGYLDVTNVTWNRCLGTE
jgi:hypothetical protein